MKKILGQISKEDLQEMVLLLCNYQTFKTLCLIYSSVDSSKMIAILEKAEKIKKRIDHFHLDMYDKYNIPVYVSNNMYIDTINGEIFVNI